VFYQQALYEYTVNYDKSNEVKVPATGIILSFKTLIMCLGQLYISLYTVNLLLSEVWRERKNRQVGRAVQGLVMGLGCQFVLHLFLTKEPGYSLSSLSPDPSTVH